MAVISGNRSDGRGWHGTLGTYWCCVWLVLLGAVQAQRDFFYEDSGQWLDGDDDLGWDGKPCNSGNDCTVAAWRFPDDSTKRTVYVRVARAKDWSQDFGFEVHHHGAKVKKETSSEAVLEFTYRDVANNRAPYGLKLLCQNVFHDCELEYKVVAATCHACPVNWKWSCDLKNGGRECKFCHGVSAGSYCTGEDSTTTFSKECEPGYYCEISNGVAMRNKCSSYHYCPAKSTYDRPCGTGYYCDFASTTRTRCPAGSKCNDGRKERCPAGTYSGAGATTCTPCSEGHSSSAGSSECQPCPAGKRTIDNRAKCEACDPGQEPTSNQESCQACDKGHFSNANNLECTECPIGTFASDSGMGSCTNCPDGQVQPKTGQVKCESCLPGTYANAENCVECAEMTFQDQSGQTLCKQCDRTGSQSAASDRQSCVCLPGRTGLSCSECAAGAGCSPYALERSCDVGGGCACISGATGRTCDLFTFTGASSPQSSEQVADYCIAYLEDPDARTCPCGHAPDGEGGCVPPEGTMEPKPACTGHSKLLDDRCYFMSDNTTDVDKARSNCLDFHLGLATIPTRAHRDFLLQLIRDETTHKATKMWVNVVWSNIVKEDADGLSEASLLAKPRWMDGSAFLHDEPWVDQSAARFDAAGNETCWLLDTEDDMLKTAPCDLSGVSFACLAGAVNEACEEDDGWFFDRVSERCIRKDVASPECFGEERAIHNGTMCISVGSMVAGATHEAATQECSRFSSVLAEDLFPGDAAVLAEMLPEDGAAWLGLDTDKFSEGDTMVWPSGAIFVPNPERSDQKDVVFNSGCVLGKRTGAANEIVWEMHPCTAAKASNSLCLRPPRKCEAGFELFDGKCIGSAERGESMYVQDLECARQGLASGNEALKSAALEVLDALTMCVEAGAWAEGELHPRLDAVAKQAAALLEDELYSPRPVELPAAEKSLPLAHLYNSSDTYYYSSVLASLTGLRAVGPGLSVYRFTPLTHDVESFVATNVPAFRTCVRAPCPCGARRDGTGECSAESDSNYLLELYMSYSRCALVPREQRQARLTLIPADVFLSRAVQCLAGLPSASGGSVTSENVLAALDRVDNIVLQLYDVGLWSNRLGTVLELKGQVVDALTREPFQAFNVPPYALDFTMDSVIELSESLGRQVQFSLQRELSDGLKTELVSELAFLSKEMDAKLLALQSNLLEAVSDSEQAMRDAVAELAALTANGFAGVHAQFEVDAAASAIQYELELEALQAEQDALLARAQSALQGALEALPLLNLTIEEGIVPAHELLIALAKEYNDLREQYYDDKAALESQQSLIQTLTMIGSMVLMVVSMVGGPAGVAAMGAAVAVSIGGAAAGRRLDALGEDLVHTTAPTLALQPRRRLDGGCDGEPPSWGEQLTEVHRRGREYVSNLFRRGDNAVRDVSTQVPSLGSPGRTRAGSASTSGSSPAPDPPTRSGQNWGIAIGALSFLTALSFGSGQVHFARSAEVVNESPEKCSIDVDVFECELPPRFGDPARVTFSCCSYRYTGAGAAPHLTDDESDGSDLCDKLWFYNNNTADDMKIYDQGGTPGHVSVCTRKADVPSNTNLAQDFKCTRGNNENREIWQVDAWRSVSYCGPSVKRLPDTNWTKIFKDEPTARSGGRRQLASAGSCPLKRMSGTERRTSTVRNAIANAVSGSGSPPRLSVGTGAPGGPRPPIKVGPPASGGMRAGAKAWVSGASKSFTKTLGNMKVTESKMIVAALAISLATMFQKSKDSISDIPPLPDVLTQEALDVSVDRLFALLSRATNSLLQLADHFVSLLDAGPATTPTEDQDQDVFSSDPQVWEALMNEVFDFLEYDVELCPQLVEIVAEEQSSGGARRLAMLERRRALDSSLGLRGPGPQPVAMRRSLESKADLEKRLNETETELAGLAGEFRAARRGLWQQCGHLRGALRDLTTWAKAAHETMIEITENTRKALLIGAKAEVQKLRENIAAEMLEATLAEGGALVGALSRARPLDSSLLGFDSSAYTRRMALQDVQVQVHETIFQESVLRQQMSAQVTLGALCASASYVDPKLIGAIKEYCDLGLASFGPSSVSLAVLSERLRGVGRTLEKDLLDLYLEDGLVKRNSAELDITEVVDMDAVRQGNFSFRLTGPRGGATLRQNGTSLSGRVRGGPYFCRSEGTGLSLDNIEMTRVGILLRDEAGAIVGPRSGKGDVLVRLSLHGPFSKSRDGEVFDYDLPAMDNFIFSYHLPDARGLCENDNPVMSGSLCFGTTSAQPDPAKQLLPAPYAEWRVVIEADQAVLDAASSVHIYSDLRGVSNEDLECRPETTGLYTASFDEVTGDQPGDGGPDQGNEPVNEEGGGLSPGGIAGISIGASAAVGLLLLAILVVRRRRRRVAGDEVVSVRSGGSWPGTVHGHDSKE